MTTLFHIDDHVNGVRLCLWTAAANRPNVHFPGDIWAWWTGGMMLTEENSWFIYQSSLATVPAESSGSKQEELVKGMMNLALQSVFIYTCEWFFMCHKILWHGVSSFTSPPGKACCRFLSPLKVHHLGWVWTCKPWVFRITPSYSFVTVLISLTECYVASVLDSVLR
jgi:hypothetical protein